MAVGAGAMVVVVVVVVVSLLLLLLVWWAVMGRFVTVGFASVGLGGDIVIVELSGVDAERARWVWCWWCWRMERVFGAKMGRGGWRVVAWRRRAMRVEEERVER